MSESAYSPSRVIDLRVQALLKDLDELRLQPHDDITLRDNLQEIIEINGTQDPAEQRYKKMLLTQTGMAISLHKKQIEHTTKCIIASSVERDNNGRILKMPWTDDIRRIEALVTEKTQEEEEEHTETPEEVSIGGKFFQFATFRGKVVTRIVTYAISVLIVIGGIVLTVRLTKQQLESVMQKVVIEVLHEKFDNDAQQVSQTKEGT